MLATSLAYLAVCLVILKTALQCEQPQDEYGAFTFFFFSLLFILFSLVVCNLINVFVFCLYYFGEKINIGA